MAEAFARVQGGGLVEASSAGLYPAAIIQPQTFQVMAERGITVADRAPQSVSELDGAAFDLVVNMSGLPVGKALRNFHGRGASWTIPDPIGQSEQVYRSSRDQIEKRVAKLLEQLWLESQE